MFDKASGGAKPDVSDASDPDPGLVAQTVCDQSRPGQSVPVSGLFGREWLRAPLRVGAIAPSSTALGAAMTAELTGASGPVVELGPGTGVFTQALLQRGIPPAQIAAIETSESFARSLSQRLPGVVVIHDDAVRVRHLCPFGLGSAGLVICGLPLLSMPRAKVLRILAGCMRVLRPDGELRLFTYGPRCPVPTALLARLDLVTHHRTFVPVNIPPALVYSIRRKAPKP